MSWYDLFQAETERLGFTLCGATAVAAPPHINTYDYWVEAGLNAGMAYLATERARERRAQPELILPEARSLLVVAMRYFNPRTIPDGPASEALGRVAAYAWGDDYHEVIPPRLESLIAALEKIIGRPLTARSYTDTGPILERDFAQTSGLGWMGKNTCLISPRSGSFYLLGETFVDAEIEPTPVFTADHCGACRRCIEACPTDAIRPDRTIDSGRCISYQTIENKGAIPQELRGQMGDWVFGCDICQTVCPWNVRFAPEAGHPALAPRPEIPRPVLRSELHLSPQEFNHKFRHSPLLRAKRRGYLRNVAVALGNQRDPATLPDLAETLASEPEPLVRGHAAWALGQFRQTGQSAQQATQALDQALEREPDPTVISEIRSALE